MKSTALRELSRRANFRSWKWRLAFAYLVLLAASHFVRWASAKEPVIDSGPAVIVPAVDGERQVNRGIRLAYREYRPSGGDAHSVIILIHGSPGHKEDFRSLAPELAKSYRVVAPDLPGFRSSTHSVPDYPTQATRR